MSHEDLVAQKLAENFEKLRSNLDNLRSMLEDMALAVPSVPDPHRLAKALLEALPEPEAAEPPPAPPAEEPAPALHQTPPPAPALNNGLLFRMASIEYAKTQSEILDQLLLSFQDFAQRGAFFIVRGNTAQAWNGFGFDSDVKRLKANVEEDPILRTVMSSRSRMLLDDNVPSFIPNDVTVRRSLISPLLLKGKVSAFLYADSGKNGKLDHYSIDILLRTASLVIDIFPLRPKRDPLPAVLENQDIVVAEAGPAEEEAMIFEDTGTLASTIESDELPTNQTIAAEIPPEAMEYESYSSESAAPSPPVEEAEIAEEPQPEPEPEPEAEIEEATVVAEVGEEEAAPAGAPEEEAVPPGEEKAHEDAQRFARLLVQEIALYHPKEVDQGKRGQNLYALLRDDIDRSKEAYNHRFQQPSIQARRYFEKALTKFLADGDESLLGM
jgi:hypothetical protein